MKRLMTAASSILILLLATSSCKPVEKTAKQEQPGDADAKGQESTVSAVFKQASRRKLNAGEYTKDKITYIDSWGIGALWGGNVTNIVPKCTVFFLDSPQNTSEESLVATQRHCVEQSSSASTANTWCDPNGLYGGNIMDWETGNRGQCTKVELLYPDRDLFIFRARINRNTSHVLQLADFVPAVNTRVAQIGFPEDLQTSTLGDLIMTRNCWILSIEPETNPGGGYGQFSFGPRARYNCTTVQGNSGGPAVIDTYPFATNNSELPVVIGLALDGSSPWSNPSDPESGAPMTYSKGYIDLERARFNEMGIRMATSQSTLGNQSRAMNAGRYTSPQYPNYNFDVLPYYYNGTDPKEIRVTFVPTAEGATNIKTYFLKCLKQPPYMMVCSFTNDRNVTLTFSFDAAASFLMEMSSSPGNQYRFNLSNNGASNG